MKASELRIGNYFIGYSNNLQQWELASFQLLIEGIEVDEIIRGFVPLTEEWLLKFGFEKDKKNKSFNLYKHNCYDLFFRIFDGGAISFCFSNEYILIKSVHQLQNLYFALTGEELIIK